MRSDPLLTQAQVLSRSLFHVKPNCHRHETGFSDIMSPELRLYPWLPARDRDLPFLKSGVSGETARRPENDRNCVPRETCFSCVSHSERDIADGYLEN
jgi:hypothetical protein